MAATSPGEVHDASGSPLRSHDGIVTPEAVVLEIETAGVGSRLAAALVDLVISFVVLMVASWVAAMAAFGDTSTAETLVMIMLFLVLLVLPVIVQVLLKGRTVGKMAFGLRAVTIDGAPLRFRHAVLRTMGGLVDRLLPPGGVTGLLFVLGTARSQSVGDLLAGTIVITDPGRGSWSAAVWFPVPHGYDAYAATIDPSRMTNEQYTVVRAFLLRNRSLSFEAREALAEELAGRLSAALGHQRPSVVRAETFLLCAVARFQRRTFPGYQPAAWTTA